MKKYTYYYGWINSDDKLNLLKTMIELFDNLEIVDIEYQEIDDEDWGMYDCGYHVRIRRNNEKYGHSDILIKGFEMEEEDL